MKLTKLEKYTMYCIMLQESEDIRRNLRNRIKTLHYMGGVIAGMCDIVSDICGEYSFGLNSFNLHEIEKHRPVNPDTYWFDHTDEGWGKRIEILKQAIKETHPDL